MARIAGIDIPRNKRIDIAITYVFGIGRTNGSEILARANVNPATRVRDLTEEEQIRIREIVEREFRVEGDLRREIQMNIKRLMDIACYRGVRHRKAYQRPHPPWSQGHFNRNQEEGQKVIIVILHPS